ncbi:MAG: cysteine-rich CWC family protein [Comamonadaceae bacterium]|nr:cysteine-rich CWC family protein [Comamonadaceae bacterium]
MSCATPASTSTCPLCHQANACAVAAGAPAASCWCMDAPVAPQALARIPAEARGRACICPHCARPAATIEAPCPPTA